MPPHHALRSWPAALPLLWMAASPARAQNHPPQPPVITEPREGRIIAPADLHMETAAFVDQDAGDAHLCTDWEVVQASDGQRVWITPCIGGLERLHTHLGDGQFSGPLAGQRALAPETAYRLRVRFRDASGDAATEWSPWSERAFTTGALTQVYPLHIEDILNAPAPRLTQPLPPGAPPGQVRLEDAAGRLLLSVFGGTSGNTVTNPPALAEHAESRVVVTAGTGPLELPASELLVTDDQGIAREIVLPAVSLAPGASAFFWVSENGSTYVGAAGQTVPDFSTLARGARVPWTAAADVRVEVVATGFRLPVNIAFIPNPRPEPDAPLYYVTELYGTVKVVRRNGVVGDYATGLINYGPSGAFPGSGEQGLTGIAVDPGTGNVYVAALYAPNPNDNSVGNPRVYRLTSADGGITSNARTVVLNMAPEVQGQSHQISNLSFGPDGYLYVHMGDGFDAGAGRNLNVFRGKVLRMTRTGQPVVTNPYFSAADGITARDYIFASGLRNPFGGAWRASDAAHYFVENGPSVDRFARLVVGRDYGYDGSDASMRTFALHNWDPATAPVNIAFVEQSVFGGSGFPSEYWGRAYVSQSGATYGGGPGTPSLKAITEWSIDASGALVGGPRTLASYNGSGQSSAVALAAGPDGLYFSDFYREEGPDPVARGASILRIRYEPPPPPPDCNGNGVPDAQDIAAGTSADCNGNGIPDECDVATGRSQDCDADGTPDECQTTVRLLETFGGGAGVWRTNGSAALTDGFVRLTPAASGLIGTLIRPPLSDRPTTSLSLEFDFRIGGGSGADGLCFALFDAARYDASTLFSEEGPGSLDHNRGGPGALTVQFDTYDNGGEGENSIEVTRDGVSLGTFSPSFELEDYAFHHASILLRDGMLTVKIVNPAGAVETAFERLPIPGTPFVGLLGFGGRTGGLNNNHDVDNVSIGVPGPNDRNGNQVPDSCECFADFNGDGFLDFFDYDDFIGCFEGSCPPGKSADFNFDGFVDFFDYDDFVGAFETGC